MPELDGFEVVRAIRERERTTGGHSPVIALTARSRKEIAERASGPTWMTFDQADLGIGTARGD